MCRYIKDCYFNKDLSSLVSSLHLKDDSCLTYCAFAVSVIDFTQLYYKALTIRIYVTTYECCKRVYKQKVW